MGYYSEGFSVIRIQPTNYSQKLVFEMLPGRADNFRIGPLDQIFPMPNWNDGEYILIPLYFYMSRYDYLGQTEVNYKTNFAKKEEAIKEFCRTLPLFEAKPERHIFFLVGDDWNIPSILRNSIVFQFSADKSGTALPLPYYDVHVTLQEVKQRFDICFMGNIGSHPVRKKLAELVKHLELDSFVEDTRKPFYFHSKEKQKDLELAYNLVMNASRYVLCPRGVGLNSIRFYEALALGKVPILIADDCKLPYATELEKAIIRVPENNLEQLPDKIAGFNVNKALEARKFYMEFLHISKFKELVENSIKEQNDS